MGLIASLFNPQSVAAQPVVGALAALVVVFGMAVSDRTRDVSCKRSAVSAQGMAGVSTACEAEFLADNSNMTLGAALCNRIDAAALAEPNCDDCTHWEAFMTHAVMLLVAAILLTLLGYMVLYLWRTNRRFHTSIEARLAMLLCCAGCDSLKAHLGVNPDERVFSTGAFARPGTGDMQQETLEYFRSDETRYNDLQRARLTLVAGNTMEYRRASEAVQRALNDGPVALYKEPIGDRRRACIDLALLLLVGLPWCGLAVGFLPGLSMDTDCSQNYVCSDLTLKFNHTASIPQPSLFTIDKEGGVQMPQECKSSSNAIVRCEFTLSCDGPDEFAVVEWLLTLAVVTLLMLSAFAQRMVEESYDLPWGKLSDYGLLVHVVVLVVSGVAGVLANELNVGAWGVLMVTQGVGSGMIWLGSWRCMCDGLFSLQSIAHDRWQDEVVRFFVSLLPQEQEDLAAGAAGPAHGLPLEGDVEVAAEAPAVEDAAAEGTAAEGDRSAAPDVPVEASGSDGAQETGPADDADDPASAENDPIDGGVQLDARPEDATDGGAEVRAHLTAAGAQVDADAADGDSSAEDAAGGVQVNGSPADVNDDGAR